MISEQDIEVGLGFDVHGCPNRCRHCWYPEGRGVDEATVRRMTEMFRQYIPAGRSETRFKKIWVMTDVREPDFSDDYRRWYDLECELSDGKPWRYELMSVWRIARDPEYLPWVKSIGPDTCQITLFGEEETTDWFYRRKGAFADAMTATERLLDVGMKPRWQIFANTKGLGELTGLQKRIGTMRLHERVEELGGQFIAFVHGWSVNGLNLPIESLRPTVKDMEAVPPELIASTQAHFGKDVLWQPESFWYREILSKPAWQPYALMPGHMPWFIIQANLDVYFNACGMDPWWRLGNFQRDSLDTILDRLVNHDTPGLRLVYNTPPQELAQRYGNPDGDKAVDTINDLLSQYVTKHFCVERA